jgi:hypothetical protein
MSNILFRRITLNFLFAVTRQRVVTFLLTDAQPKNALVNPHLVPPKGRNDVELGTFNRAKTTHYPSRLYGTICNTLDQILHNFAIHLQIDNFQASLNHRAYGCSCSLDCIVKY